MKGFFLVLGMTVATAAPAAADTIHVLYENTLTLTDGEGGVRTVLLRKDGKFEQTNSRGMWAAGFWVKLDNRFCMTARGEFEICFTLEPGKSVGDTWEIRGPTGSLAWTARIEDGRADPGPGAPAGDAP